jgi:hypothetical protein
MRAITEADVRAVLDGRWKTPRQIADEIKASGKREFFGEVYIFLNKMVNEGAAESREVKSGRQIKEYEYRLRKK